MTGRVVVVSTGTYHLPFDRLIDWVGRWPRPDDVTVILQHGVGRPLDGCQNHVMLAPDALMEIYRTATALVLQGGAGGIMDARAAGRIPIIVPRVPGSGEVVDDHQLAFTNELASMGLVHRCLTEAALHATLDGVIDGRLTSRSQPTPSPGVGASIDLLDRAFGTVTYPTTLSRAWRMARRTVVVRRRRDRHAP